MLKVLPLPIMVEQRLVMLASSCGLSVAARNGDSVVAKPPVESACTVVPKASKPLTKGKAAVPANPALLVQVAPVNPAPAPVLTSFTTTEFGRTTVKDLTPNR